MFKRLIALIFFFTIFSFTPSSVFAATYTVNGLDASGNYWDITGTCANTGTQNGMFGNYDSTWYWLDSWRCNRSHMIPVNEETKVITFVEYSKSAICHPMDVYYLDMELGGCLVGTPTELTLVPPTPVASAEISVSPSGGTDVVVGTPFMVTLSVGQVNSHITDPFNAVQADVSVSSNLTIDSFETSSASCNLQYTESPSTENPSFDGIIFESSSSSCEIYTMVVTPNAEGEGTIAITDGSVKTLSDSSEILQIMGHETFSITTP